MFLVLKLQTTDFLLYTVHLLRGKVKPQRSSSIKSESCPSKMLCNPDITDHFQIDYQLRLYTLHTYIYHMIVKMNSTNLEGNVFFTLLIMSCVTFLVVCHLTID